VVIEYSEWLIEMERMPQEWVPTFEDEPLPLELIDPEENQAHEEVQDIVQNELMYLQCTHLGICWEHFKHVLTTFGAHSDYIPDVNKMFSLGKSWAKCLNACNVLNMFPLKSRSPHPWCVLVLILSLPGSSCSISS
jgi:hypothetical protein